MPPLLSLSLSNLTRHRLRSLVTVVGVAVAIATLFCLASFQRGYQAGLGRELDRLGAHLLVVPKGCPYDAASIALHGASWPCYLKSAYLQTVRQTPHVAWAAPVLMNAVYETQTIVPEDTRAGSPQAGAQIVYCGVDPDIIHLKRLWCIRGRFPSSGELLVGAELARSRGWSVGQTVRLPGLDGPQARVGGVLDRTEGADDLFVYLPLADAQRLFHRPGQLTHILVKLDTPESMDSVVGNLRGCDAGLEMNVVPLAHLFRTIQALVESTRLLLGCVVVIALLVAGAGVSNTLLMAVLERTREIGVLRAVGTTRSDVFGLIWMETVALCLLGGVLGIGLARVGAGAVEAWLRGRLPFAPHGSLIQVEWQVVLLCLGVSLGLGTLASLLPAWRAARLAPAEALRAMGGI